MVVQFQLPFVIEKIDSSISYRYHASQVLGFVGEPI